MSISVNFLEADLPGELIDIDNLIPFPGGWEPDDNPPAACALCGDECTASETGICDVCAQRLPGGPDCPLTIQYLVAVASGGDLGRAVDHVATCPACQTAFDRIGWVGIAAAQEADMQNAHTAVALAGNAA